ncbi:unnamed protein product [Strongylus vulgaris]|uniref:Uncharacterized protein n=1 Tax=Strongylus vulgaris TaxID=40348 RepID=A0A3P7LQE6_STRVU|nr:unnamed protein product [Strongylus vulgaris]
MKVLALLLLISQYIDGNATHRSLGSAGDSNATTRTESIAPNLSQAEISGIEKKNGGEAGIKLNDEERAEIRKRGVHTSNLGNGRISKRTSSRDRNQRHTPDRDGRVRAKAVEKIVERSDDEDETMKQDDGDFYESLARHLEQARKLLKKKKKVSDKEKDDYDLELIEGDSGAITGRDDVGDAGFTSILLHTKLAALFFQLHIDLSNMDEKTKALLKRMLQAILDSDKGKKASGVNVIDDDVLKRTICSSSHKRFVLKQESIGCTGALGWSGNI